MNNKAKSGNIKKLDLSYIIMLLVLVSCSAPSTDGYEVKGKLQNGAGKSIYIDELTAASATTIDSAVIDQEGNYFLEGEIAEPGFFRMRLEQNNFVNIILNPGDRIAQFLLIPVINIEYNFVDEFEITERSSGGFGHSGKN